MSKRRSLGILISVVVLALVLGAILLHRPNEDADVVRIGVVLPLTGPAAQYGNYVLQGMQLAVDEVNGSGMLGDRRFQIVAEDSRADPKQAVTAVQKLTSVDRVPAILCLTTGDTSAVSPICQRTRTVLITETVAPGAADQGDFVFRNASNLAGDAEAMAHLCVERLGHKRVGMLALNIAALREIEGIFRSKLESLGGTLLPVEYGDKGDTDFRTQLTKLKAKSPEAVYLLGYVEVAYMLKQAGELGLNVQFLGDPSMESPKVLEIAGAAAEGVIYTRAAFDPQADDEKGKAFAAEYSARFGQQPEVFAAQTYDSVHILARVIDKGAASATAIREGLLKVKHYPGVSGQTTFLANGDVHKPTAFYTIKNGAFVRYSAGE
jgi:branched-chain amino acid transport system substrate-binding protein